MKKITFLGLISLIIISGCDTSHNFMDIDNPNAKDDLKYYVSDGRLSGINTNDIIPKNLSGVREDAKGYADKYYDDTLEEYIDVAKKGLSGTKENLKGYYNSGIDEINRMINEKVNETISGELNKFKIK